MPGDSTTNTVTLREKPVVSAGKGERLSKWLLFSFFLHGALLIALVLSPYFPSQTTSAPPVYTVDLVGGDKIGGTRPGTQIEPSPPPKETKQEVKEAPKMRLSEPAPRLPEIIKEPPKTKQKPEETEIIDRLKKVEKVEKPDKPVKIVEKPKIEAKPAQEAVKPDAAKNEALKEPLKAETPKKEPVKELKSEAVRNEPAEGRTEPMPAQSSESSLDKVRERLIQSALDRVKSRTESAQKAANSKTQDAVSVGPGEGDGAAAIGPGGRGGGTVVKGADFLIYQSKIISAIKGNWAWAGQKGTLKALVRFGIKDNGEITGIKVAEPSGDPAFDQSVLRALRKSSPLPAPPESYRNDFSQVEMNFQP